MALQETLGRREEKPMLAKEIDVRREAENMIQRHKDQIKELRELSGGSEAFREASIKATEKFKNKLKAFLSKHGAAGMYEELLGFVIGNVSEIISSASEKSSQT